MAAGRVGYDALGVSLKGCASMMDPWRYRREDVVAWPDDPQACKALGRFLDAASTEPEVFPTFPADFLDFVGPI